MFRVLYGIKHKYRQKYTLTDSIYYGQYILGYVKQKERQGLLNKGKDKMYYRKQKNKKFGKKRGGRRVSISDRIWAAFRYNTE